MTPFSEMGEINPKFKEGPEETRLSAILATIKRYVFNNGVNVIEPLKDFDTFNEGRLNKSQMKRALHLLRIGYGLRCSIGEDDMEFLLNSYSTDGVFVDYKSFVTELMQGERLTVAVKKCETRSSQLFIQFLSFLCIRRPLLFSPFVVVVENHSKSASVVPDELVNWTH